MVLGQLAVLINIYFWEARYRAGCAPGGDGPGPDLCSHQHLLLGGQVQSWVCPWWGWSWASMLFSSLSTSGRPGMELGVPLVRMVLGQLTVLINIYFWEARYGAGCAPGGDCPGPARCSHQHLLLGGHLYMTLCSIVAKCLLSMSVSIHLSLTARGRV
jgi:hypothetical protein